LVNPIGAIVNGVETLSQDPDFAAEATSLIALSAREAAQRLQFYRLAYGSTIGPGEEAARSATIDLFSDGKIAFEWAEGLPPMPPGWIKLAMNLVLVAAECLPRGGRVRMTAVGEEAGRLTLSAEGQGARLPQGLPELLDPEQYADRITPRTVHISFTSALARRIGHELELLVIAEDQIEVRLRPIGV
jgi:histidine phosphotransferase ChpT